MFLLFVSQYYMIWLLKSDDRVSGEASRTSPGQSDSGADVVDSGRDMRGDPSSVWQPSNPTP